MRDLVTIPDKRLRQKSEPVKKVDGYIKELIQEMLAMLEKAGGVGLAAPQLGEMVRVIVIRLQGIEIVLINPEIVKAKGSHNVIEGCLSIPGRLYEVVRPKIVKAKGIDMDGKDISTKGHDLLAQALCHEVDHLDGIMIDVTGQMAR